MVVKGSKQYRSRVVVYSPATRLAWIAFGTLFVCGLVALAFCVGYREAQRDQQLAIREWEQLQSRAAEQEEQIQYLNAQLSNTQVGSNVDKQALEVLRKQIFDLNQKIADLQESNNFYRQLMEPAADSKGLAIGSLKLLPLPTPRQYHYQILIQQFAKDPRTLTGRANVTLVGTLAGAPKNFALHELDRRVAGVDVPLKFRFFQSLEGELTLPEGFELARVDVTVEKTGSGVPVQRSFDWQKATQTY